MAAGKAWVEKGHLSSPRAHLSPHLPSSSQAKQLAPVPLAGLPPLLAEPFCLEFSWRSWNQSRRRSPRSARSWPVQVSAERGGGGWGGG